MHIHLYTGDIAGDGRSVADLRTADFGSGLPQGQGAFAPERAVFDFIHRGGGADDDAFFRFLNATQFADTFQTDEVTADVRAIVVIYQQNRSACQIGAAILAIQSQRVFYGIGSVQIKMPSNFFIVPSRKK